MCIFKHLKTFPGRRNDFDTRDEITDIYVDTSQLLLLGKFEYGGGLIFKVVLEC